jgi:hypothetical protein
MYMQSIDTIVTFSCIHLHLLLRWFPSLSPSTTVLRTPLSLMTINTYNSSISKWIFPTMTVCTTPMDPGLKAVCRPSVCSHAFHLECLCRWTSTNRTCPTCRREVTALIGMVADLLAITIQRLSSMRRSRSSNVQYIFM